MKSRAGPNGVHLFDRRSGLNILLDELQSDEGEWAKAPRQVSVALTNVCDLHCAYCYAPKHKASLREDDVVTWLKEIDGAGCLGVGFGGGEPTLHPGFSEICRRVAEETQLAVTFTTHGHRLSQQLVDSIKGSVHFVRVSVDGMGATYEALRGRTFADLLPGVERLARATPFGINVVVNDQTVSALEGLGRLARELGACELLLLPQQATPSAAGISESTNRALGDWVRSYRGAVRLAVSEAGASGLPTCDPLPDERGLRAYAHIDASGMLRASSYSPTATAIGSDGAMAALMRLAKTIGIRQEMEA